MPQKFNLNTIIQRLFDAANQKGEPLDLVIEIQGGRIIYRRVVAVHNDCLQTSAIEATYLGNGKYSRTAVPGADLLFLRTSIIGEFSPINDGVFYL